MGFRGRRLSPRPCRWTPSPKTSALTQNPRKSAANPSEQLVRAVSAVVTHAPALPPTLSADGGFALPLALCARFFVEASLTEL